MSTILLFEKQLLENHRKNLRHGEKLIERRQQCSHCDHVLAMQISSNNLDKQSQAIYYVVKDALFIKGEAYLLYKKERWFGNFIRCPVCGNQGKLPMDKPLNWELMEKPKEVANAIQSN